MTVPHSSLISVKTIQNDPTVAPGFPVVQLLLHRQKQGFSKALHELEFLLILDRPSTSHCSGPEQILKNVETLSRWRCKGQNRAGGDFSCHSRVCKILNVHWNGLQILVSKPKFKKYSAPSPDLGFVCPLAYWRT